MSVGLALHASRRSLLGLDRERESGTTVWEPTLFAAAGAPLAAVDRGSAPVDKVALYRSLFVGRDDVYALRWQNDRTRKSG